ncbi:hypothetical protein N8630_00110 [Synechococcus sp. AH-601-C19]|nr:hypothetical protein [Synechococcus sp. AH-601-C19]
MKRKIFLKSLCSAVAIIECLFLINAKEVFSETDETGFTGVVPFVCSIENDDQIKEMSYTPVSGIQAKLSGLDQSLMIVGNSNAYITAELISEANLFGSNIQSTSTTLFPNGSPQYYVNGLIPPVNLKNGPIPLWLLFDAFVSPTPANYEFNVLITCIHSI